MSHKVYPEKEWFLYQYGRPYILYTKKNKACFVPPSAFGAYSEVQLVKGGAKH